MESIAVVALNQRLNLINGQNNDGKIFFNGLKEFLELSVELEIKPSLWRLFATKNYKRAMKLLDDMVYMVESYVSKAVERIQKQPSKSEDHELSVLEKLLAIDKKIATIMAMDMLFAGGDTVCK